MWLQIGASVARAIILGVGAVERSGTTFKGEDKRALALQFAQEALGICNEAAPKAMNNPAIQEALKEYNDAYVKLQNALAKNNA